MHGNFGDFMSPPTGRVLAGGVRSAALACERARQHTVNGGGWLLAVVGFACLAVICGLSGDPLGTLLLICASLGCCYPAWRQLEQLSEARYDAGLWEGVAHGRRDMEEEIERGMWGVEVRIQEYVR